ncbi:MAG: nitroreductase family protein [Thermoplasmatota archaeon]
MNHNKVIETIMDHKSIRNYTDEVPTEEEIKTIVRAGQQAPFVSQLYSVVYTKDKDKIPFNAPVMFTVCVDTHKLELFMEKRDWDLVTNDLTLLLFGIQDAAYMAQNMVTAARSLGLGSCFLGGAIHKAKKLKEEYNLPDKVFPLVQLTMGYPAENPPRRPRYPMDFVLFEDEYPDFDEETLEKAIDHMDDGYLEQDYYKKLNAKIPIEGDKEDTYNYEDYSWTEHISRKWGQWFTSIDEQIEELEMCGFDISENKEED